MVDKVTIEAERVGLPVTATAEQIRDRVYELQSKLAASTADAEKWKERALENQTALIEARKDQTAKKELEGEVLIAAAHDADKIDRSEMEFYRKLYRKDPELCKERLENLAERRYLRTQESLKGDIVDPTLDASAEFTIKLAEMVANHPKLSEAECARKVYTANKGLFERLQKARRERNAAKEGSDR